MKANAHTEAAPNRSLLFTFVLEQLHAWLSSPRCPFIKQEYFSYCNVSMTAKRNVCQVEKQGQENKVFTSRCY